MGTSSSGGGAGNGNPLIPSWIPSGNGAGPNATPPPEDPKNKPSSPKENPPDKKTDVPQQLSPKPLPPTPLPTNNRYTPPQRDFNKFVSSRGSNGGALRRALKGYSRNAAASSSGLARRMTPTVVRIAGFVRAVNTIREDGLESALRQFNISTYVNRSLVDTLSALSDEIFSDTGRAFESTQDDSITKHAYANTIVRICEIESLDLGNLSNENVELMMAVFIEESIAQRVITDIGNNMTEKEFDLTRLIEIENTVYQMVNGLVRNEIMPEIIATQRGNRDNLEKNIENVYRMAFDVLSSLND